MYTRRSPRRTRQGWRTVPRDDVCGEVAAQDSSWLGCVAAYIRGGAPWNHVVLVKRATCSDILDIEIAALDKGPLSNALRVRLEADHLMLDSEFAQNEWFDANCALFTLYIPPQEWLQLLNPVVTTQALGLMEAALESSQWGLDAVIQRQGKALCTLVSLRFWRSVFEQNNAKSIATG